MLLQNNYGGLLYETYQTLITLLLLLLLVGCQQRRTGIVRTDLTQNKFLLGTIVNITLYDNPQQSIFDEIFTAIRGN